MKRDQRDVQCYQNTWEHNVKQYYDHQSAKLSTYISVLSDRLCVFISTCHSVTDGNHYQYKLCICLINRYLWVYFTNYCTKSYDIQHIILKPEKKNCQLISPFVICSSTPQTQQLNILKFPRLKGIRFFISLVKCFFFFWTQYDLSRFSSDHVYIMSMRKYRYIFIQWFPSA